MELNELLQVAAKAELIFMQESDRFEFLKSVTGNWNNHLPLLLLALRLTDNAFERTDVVELGSGLGSTKYLRDYCGERSRYFNSYDNNKEWAEKCGAQYVDDWDGAPIWQSCGLLFVDHAPGEHRKVAIERMKDKAEIIVIHDTEEGGQGDYRFDTIWHLFKYRLNYNKTGGGAGATAVSNTIDLNRFRGLSLGQFTFDND